MKHDHHSADCPCCCNSADKALEQAGLAFLSRRELILGAGATVVGSWVMTSKAADGRSIASQSEPAMKPAKALVVQPVLTYAIPHRKEQTSWRSWGGLMSQSDVDAEMKRIESELQKLAADRELAVTFKPLIGVQNAKEAAAIKEQTADVMLVYASGGGRDALEALVIPDRPTLFFIRHKSGPVSLWYEIMHPHFLRKATDKYAQPGVTVDDVVVDSYEDLAWRLKSLRALRQTLGSRIIAIGGAGGWGEGHKVAPQIAREKWKLDIRDVSYDDLGKRLKSIRQDTKAAEIAAQQATAFLKEPGVDLQCDRNFVVNAFLLYRVFKDLLKENDATAMTIQHCMGTVMPISETSACLPLSLLNDEGCLAFCESDFVVIPSGILMHHLTGTPVFLNDPTWPHHGIVTLAHCTAPRKMNGQSCEPTKILTHFESDYGAAPKVEMTKGTVTTNVVPDFNCRKWVGFKATVQDNPFLPICRSQIDVAIEGNWERLVQEMRGFHWMLVYGDCRKEVGYAIKHLGIDWEDVSA